MKVLKRVLLILLILCAASGGIYLYLLPDEQEVVIADLGTISPVLKGTGILSGNETITIYADTSGSISARYAAKGQRVKAGDKLLDYEVVRHQDAVDLASLNVEYDQKIINAIKESRAKNQSKLNDAKLRISQCEQVYANLKFNILALENTDYKETYEHKEQEQILRNDIEKMQKEVQAKQSELQKIEYELRYMELTEDGDEKKVRDLVDESKYYQDSIRKTNESISNVQRQIICLPIEGMAPETHAMYALLQNDLETVSRLWTEAKTDKDTAESAVRAYEELLSNEKVSAQDTLALSQAERELSEASGGTIAPEDGVITDCMVDVGAQVEKGTPVFTMQKENSYLVKMLVSKYDISSLHTGQRAKIYVGNDEYRGTLQGLSQYAENDASGKAKASASIEVYTNESMILGLESDVEIELERVENAVRIPIDCLYTDNLGDYVFVSEKGIVRRKYFETGVRDAKHVQALTVIKAGDHIVSDMDAAQYEGEKIKEVMSGS